MKCINKDTECSCNKITCNNIQELFTQKYIDQMFYWISVDYKWKRIDPRNLFIWENYTEIIDFDKQGNKYSIIFNH